MKRITDPDVRLLQAAADPVRLNILRQLSSDGPTCACDFNECCDISQSTVSHHLKVLREAGWIEGERRGTWIWYSIRAEAAERLGAILGGIQAGVARPAMSFSSTAESFVPAGESLATATDEVRTLPVLQSDWKQW